MREKRFAQEQTLLTEERSRTNSVIKSSTNDVPAVGPLLYSDVLIEGVPIKAMVDTGAQSTILSRKALHTIAQHLRATNQPLPRLEVPTATLYRNDGSNGGPALDVTAQVDLRFFVDDATATVPVFIQPNSEQPCLLGVNALLPLGYDISSPRGESLITQRGVEPLSKLFLFLEVEDAGSRPNSMVNSVPKKSCLSLIITTLK